MASAPMALPMVEFGGMERETTKIQAGASDEETFEKHASSAQLCFGTVRLFRFNVSTTPLELQTTKLECMTQDRRHVVCRLQGSRLFRVKDLTPKPKIEALQPPINICLGLKP